MRSPRTATKSSPRLLQLEKARAQQRRPNAGKNKINKINKLKKKKRKRKKHFPVLLILRKLAVPILQMGKLSYSSQEVGGLRNNSR